MTDAQPSGPDIPADDSAELAVGGADALGGDRAGRRTHAEFALALILDLVGAVGAILVALQTWQVVTVHAAPPRPDVTVHVTGHAVDSAPLAFALVALAGVVAVLATRGIVRRVVGAIVAVVGVGLIWRAITAAGAVSASQARSLVHAQHREVSVPSGAASIATHAAWPVLTVACGVLVVAGGALVAARGQRWRAMSARYESDPARAADPQRAAASMWTALDRGDDPTSRPSG
ncbi:Trp biosynthesis-associated membrane protein [Jatrophihabitans endophyticus]|uniref:Trp biosynthesis-associated membrane protein n=1 Tax=Jatrophihabitans endophyticus TaxID=1206085 RepID=UPI0019FF153A|nr:Trp biosynthesis-associated membrane protein [Jatrophihabitans endophyticus]MBE7187399.1 Trp biosynthesis-associated membrane protein [Jatrophihabitans endophyticus]